MSAELDELNRRILVLEGRIKELEKRTGLLAAILTVAFVLVFISFVTVFFLGPGPLDNSGPALIVVSLLLVFLFILGRRTLESSVRKASKAIDEHTQHRPSMVDDEGPH